MRILFSLLLLLACLNAYSSGQSVENDEIESRDFRQDMRNFVQKISTYAKSINPDFLIIPQNGQELMTLDGTSGGTLANDYLTAIDGVGREDLFYGYHNDDIKTPDKEIEYMTGFLDLAMINNIVPLVIDYCDSTENISDSYSKNSSKGYVSFTTERELDIIPSILYSENSNDIDTLKNAKNFLFLLNTHKFDSKSDFLNSISKTNYDVIIIDLYYEGDMLLLASQINKLKTKQNGGKRLVIAYLSIGEAEDYRYYWKNKWDWNPPVWIEKENPEWRGNYKVRYWIPEWQNIIFGNNNSYIKNILDSGFDGVYLDLIDAFEYFEEDFLPLTRAVDKDLVLSLGEAPKEMQYYYM